MNAPPVCHYCGSPLSPVEPTEPTPEPPRLPNVVKELHEAALALDGPQSVPASLNHRRFREALNAFKAWVPTAAPPVGVSPQPDQQRRGNYYGQPLSVSVQDGRLVVAIGVQTIAHATAFADWANPFDEAADDYIRTFAIEDAPQFAKDVVSAMLSESEDGSTPLSDFLDKMAQAAIDDGSLGIHEDEQQIKHGTFAPCETWAVQSPASLSPVESTPSREPLTGAELKVAEP